MIGTIRKHSKILWWIVIVVIILSFVVWNSQTTQSGGNSGSDSGNLGSINGKPITVNKFAETQREVALMYFFASGGSWPDKARNPNFDLDRESYFRLLLIQKQGEMGIHVSDDAVVQAASDRLRSMNRGNPVAPDVFAREVLEPQRLSLSDYERYIRHELGLQQLASTLGLSGELITPQELQALYARENQELQAQVAFFSASNYVGSITGTPEQIAQFYTNRMPNYRLPERVQVNYVKFPLTNFLAEAVAKINELTNLNEVLDGVYLQRGGTNFYTDAKSPEEAKQRILKEEQEGMALDFARKKASEFATELFNQTPVQAENLVTLAKARGLTPLVSPPFSRDEPPAGWDVRAEFTRAAFALNAEEPFTQPLVGNDGVYLLSLIKTLPSENPPFETVREQVTQDYRYAEAFMAARKAAMDFGTTATNINSLPAFTAACTVAKVKPVALPPFALNTRKLEAVEGHVRLSDFKQAAFSTPPGQMSQLQGSGDGAYVVFVQEKLPLNQSAMATNLAAFERNMRQTRRSEAFNAWFSKEAEKGFRDVPFFQQQAKAANAAGMPTQ